MWKVKAAPGALRVISDVARGEDEAAASAEALRSNMARHGVVKALSNVFMELLSNPRVGEREGLEGCWPPSA